MQEISQRILREVKKTVIGKDDIVRKVYMTILAGGHILLEDIPGVGKTTLALAFAGAMALRFRRLQFTPDVTPSDITGYSVPDPATGKLQYRPGAAVCNLFLGDEINRASPKTQSALLEVMEEGQLTVDGVTRRIPPPFIVIATQNPEGSAGTQPLPESQLDRFMICVSMGYPTIQEEMEILKRNENGRAPDSVCPVIDADELLAMRREVAEIYVHDRIYHYIAELARATRENEWTELGLSPRGTVALASMSKACAYLRGRAFVVPSDVAEVFPCVASHRIFLNMKAKVGHIQVSELIRQVLEKVEVPALKTRRQ